jgi:hypothetical protein
MIEVRLTPRAACDRVDGIARDAAGHQYLAVRVTAAPVDGAANTALIDLLARRWRLPKSAFDLVKGDSARLKRLCVTAAPDRLKPVLADLETAA